MKQRFLALLCTVIICLSAAGCEKTPAPEPIPETETPAESTPQLQDPLLCDFQVVYTRSIQRNLDTVDIFETAPADDLQLRLYQTENRDRVTMGRLQNTMGETSMYAWEIPADGSIHWYDAETDQWLKQPLEEGTYTASMIELAMEDGSSYLIYLPKTYRKQEADVLEYLPAHNGSLTAARNETGWRFDLVTSLPDESCVSDFTMVQGVRPMLNWEHDYCGNLWKHYTMETEGKWCFDGYYWPCPENYIPTGENYLYRCAAGYLIRSLCNTARIHPAADNLTLAMLDTMVLEQNEAGYWATTPRSDWLYTDYGIDEGFYDTRFNSDLMETFRKYYRFAGGDVFREAMERYVSFYVDFAEKEHFSTESGGWFIPDYTPYTTRKPHASLNHLLAECIVLYHLSEDLEMPHLTDLADRILLAISDTQEDWINDSGDLHYCVFPEGDFGLQDYPYLTYNDLLDTQNLLLKTREQTNPTLQFLMEHKLRWMEENDITEYKK